MKIIRIEQILQYQSRETVTYLLVTQKITIKVTQPLSLFSTPFFGLSKHKL